MTRIAPLVTALTTVTKHKRTDYDLVITRISAPYSGEQSLCRPAHSDKYEKKEGRRHGEPYVIRKTLQSAYVRISSQ
jgi:hypothetical protein